MVPFLFLNEKIVPFIGKKLPSTYAKKGKKIVTNFREERENLVPFLEERERDSNIAIDWIQTLLVLGYSCTLVEL